MKVDALPSHVKTLVRLCKLASESQKLARPISAQVLTAIDPNRSTEADKNGDTCENWQASEQVRIVSSSDVLSVVDSGAAHLMCRTLMKTVKSMRTALPASCGRYEREAANPKVTDPNCEFGDEGTKSSTAELL